MLKVSLILILIFLDYFSKKIVFNYIDMNSFIYILPFLDITHIHNYGIAFGFLTGLVPPWMIIIVSILITFLIVYMMKTSSSYAEKTGFLLIVIGASSNIVDRFINNYVLDFIYLHYGDFYWPAFNFADIYITIGVVFIIYKAFNDFFSRSRK